MAHLEPLARHELNEELQALFDHYTRTRGFMPNSILTMARRPNISKAFGALNQAILYEGTVEVELKMLVSLVSSVASGCLYCQSHMTNLSSIYDASDEKIAAVWEFESSELFSEAERAALRVAMKAGQVPNGVTETDFDSLKQYFDEGQIVEIIASVALFGYLNRWNDTMATALETLPTEVAERVVGGVGWGPGKHGGGE
ncbi:MAG: carboxymuconolactone decarboxylase family protein [Gammaproteobacteria bacterium]|nr:carboxymuconolactone decarboxylase family protein [Gammaproteobacteria bacterium]